MSNPTDKHPTPPTSEKFVEITNKVYGDACEEFVFAYRQGQKDAINKVLDAVRQALICTDSDKLMNRIIDVVIEENHKNRYVGPTTREANVQQDKE